MSASILNPTAANLLTDPQGRPYFLWDMDLTLDAFRERLSDPDADIRAYFIGKLMRQAKPDDVFAFVTPKNIRDHWPRIERHLGQTRAFWTWLIDLLADPVASTEPPLILRLGEARVQVDSRHEILVNKFCALLGRMELRDLQDVQELLDGGGDFMRALRDASRKDGGFSPLILAWTLKGMPTTQLAAAAGWDVAATESIDGFRHALIDRLTSAAAPQ